MTIRSLLLQDVRNCHRAVCGDADKGRSDVSRKTAETCLSSQEKKKKKRTAKEINPLAFWGQLI